MKTHPLLVLGIVVVSAVAGYYFRAGFAPAVVPAPAIQVAVGAEPAPEWEPPPPRRTLAAIEEENEIRRVVEEREQALAQAPAAESASLERQPVVVEKFSAAPFYDELAPHGEWLEADGYGDVWQPASARESDWQPYVDGGWAYTEAGWTWDSDEPGGDITCHYGRWVNLTESGWCWVPGHEWAPAWVSWRCSDEFIGWAPLPPCVPWRPAAGIGPWVDACGDLGPGSYCFVPIRHFVAANCRPVLCPRGESATHFGRTRNLTRLVCKPAADGRARPVLEGPDLHRIAALSPKDLRYRRLQWVNSSPPRGAKVTTPDVVAVREFVVPPAAGGPERGAKASRRLDRVAVVNPWREVADPQVMATARRQVFAQAHETFRGLPRLVPPVESRKPAAPRRPSDEPSLAKTPVIESVREQSLPTRPARGPSATAAKVAAAERLARRTEVPEVNRSAAKETAGLSARPVAAPEPIRDASSTSARPPRGASLAPATLEPSAPIVSRRLEPAPSLAPRETARERSTTRTAERLAAQAARDQEVRETLREQQAVEAQTARQQREQERRQQLAQQQEQQEHQRQTLAALEREQDAREREADQQRAQQARNQAMAEQQQQRVEAEHQAMAERQRQQSEARQQQENERRQQLEQARQQAAFEAHRQQEAQQREQLEQSRRQAEMSARQAADQRQRENEARQQQAEAHRRQAEDNQRRQQLQEAQERAQAARQQQMEEARQRQQAEAGRQREQEAARQRDQEAARQRDQEAARQQGGHAQGKRGR